MTLYKRGPICLYADQEEEEVEEPTPVCLDDDQRMEEGGEPVPVGLVAGQGEEEGEEHKMMTDGDGHQ